MKFQLSMPCYLASCSQRGWCVGITLVLGLIWGLVMVPLPVLAQDQAPGCLVVTPSAIQLSTRGYTFGCVPDNWNLYRMEDEAWYRGTQTLTDIQFEQQDVFVAQFKAGNYDDYVSGDPPAWQNGAAVQWQRDFAGVGYRSVSSGQENSQVVPLFLMVMWAASTLEVDSLATTLSAQADNYDTVELTTLTVGYLDGEEAVPPQIAYVLDGAEMQELFHLDSGFLNSKYVVIHPTEASRTLTGIPVLVFFSSSPLTLSDLQPLLQSLQFRHRLPPAEPDPETVANLHTPLGILELVPEIQAAATTLVSGKRAEILASAISFAREMPYSQLLPFQLHTSDTDLYWAPASMKTGRLILWEYTDGTHSHSSVTTWTFTAQGQTVDLMDILAVSAEEALNRITNAAVEHLTNSAAGMTTTESRDWVTAGLTGLDVVRAWNPTTRRGQEGLWITLEPYVIAPYNMGIQEFFVPMALQAPE